MVKNVKQTYYFYGKLIMSSAITENHYQKKPHFNKKV